MFIFFLLSFNVFATNVNQSLKSYWELYLDRGECIYAEKSEFTEPVVKLIRKDVSYQYRFSSLCAEEFANYVLGDHFAYGKGLSHVEKSQLRAFCKKSGWGCDGSYDSLGARYKLLDLNKVRYEDLESVGMLRMTPTMEVEYKRFVSEEGNDLKLDYQNQQRFLENIHATSAKVGLESRKDSAIIKKPKAIIKKPKAIIKNDGTPSDKCRKAIRTYYPKNQDKYIFDFGFCAEESAMYTLHYLKANRFTNRQSIGELKSFCKNMHWQCKSDWSKHNNFDVIRNSLVHLYSSSSESSVLSDSEIREMSLVTLKQSHSAVLNQKIQLSQKSAEFKRAKDLVLQYKLEPGIKWQVQHLDNPYLKEIQLLEANAQLIDKTWLQKYCSQDVTGWTLEKVVSELDYFTKLDTNSTSECTSFNDNLNQRQADITDGICSDLLVEIKNTQFKDMNDVKRLKGKIPKDSAEQCIKAESLLTKRQVEIEQLIQVNRKKEERKCQNLSNEIFAVYHCIYDGDRFERDVDILNWPMTHNARKAGCFSLESCNFCPATNLPSYCNDLAERERARERETNYGPRGSVKVWNLEVFNK